MSGPGSAAPINPLVAGGLVFFVSGAVLVLEILAARLLAPYVGLSLETYTAIIGVVLAGISAGTWAGGRFADVVEPRRIVGPVVVAGGVLAMTTLPAARAFGELAEGRSWYALALVTLMSFFLPTAVLSAVNPLVVKDQLQSLGETGRVVGRLSALGTAGAIVGTFLTGFVLLPAFAASRVVLVVGALVVVAGLALTLMRGTGARKLLAILVPASLLLGAVAARAENRCDAETAYYCAVVEGDLLGRDPTRRVLKLDSLLQSYVDLDDPRFLGFPYTQRLGDVADAVGPGRAPVDALHIGGGGFNVPGYIGATRPGSSNLILELDQGVVDLARERLGLRTGARMRVRVGDARVTMKDLPDDSFDLAVGDAFAGVSVPWHLTTREALEEVRRVLRPGGLYAMNVIDDGPRHFLRAEIRTLTEVFRHVAVIAQPSLRSGVLGGSNYLVLAADGQIPVRRVEAGIARRAADDVVLTGPAVRGFAGDAELLTDDYAPADQLYTP